MGLEQTLVAVDSYNIARMAPYIGPSIAVQTCYEVGRLFQKKHRLGNFAEGRVINGKPTFFLVDLRAARQKNTFHPF